MALVLLAYVQRTWRKLKKKPKDKRGKRGSVWKTAKAVVKLYVWARAKIIIKTYQMLGLLGVTYHIDWPEKYEEVVQDQDEDSEVELPAKLRKVQREIDELGGCDLLKPISP